MCPKHFDRETSSPYPNQMSVAPQLPPGIVEEQWLYAELLLDDQVLHFSNREPGRHINVVLGTEKKNISCSDELTFS